jgi:hypothetical protein
MLHCSVPANVPALHVPVGSTDCFPHKGKDDDDPVREGTDVGGDKVSHSYFCFLNPEGEDVHQKEEGVSQSIG